MRASRTLRRDMASLPKVAILIFDDVEVLDFAGPFEVFSVAGRQDGDGLFDVFTVAETGAPVAARNRLMVTPTYSIASAPQPDILLIPGGYGTRREVNNEALIGWIGERAETADLVLSVCTGALLLAKAGLLDGLSATTHWGALDLLEKLAPNTQVLRDARVVDNGRVVTSAGVAAGIDMAFHVLARLHGQSAAEKTAHYMEFPWPRDALQVSNLAAE